MCGILGYAGDKQAAALVLEGLGRLEYRGYDSAGIAVMNANGRFSLRKAVGRLSVLRSSVGDRLPQGTTGIGHTRWATHGKPSVPNAHPHEDCQSQIVLVHNGIIENYLPIKRRLLDEGHRFTSQTDTETLAHLMEAHLAKGKSLREALTLTAHEIEGSNCLLVMSRHEPGVIAAARLGNAGGIVIGYGDGEMWLASDLPAILPHTRRVVFLAHREIAVVNSRGATYFDLEGGEVQKKPQVVAYDSLASAKGGYKHFMLKEIMEQPQAVMDALRGRVDFEASRINLDEFPYSSRELKKISRVMLVACGTSLHAAQVGRVYMERLAGLPAEVEAASEFRYREPHIDSGTLLVSVAQSGETADTLAAMEEGRRRGVPQVAVCNVEGSQATRMADGTVFIRAGPEIGVASSKTFTASLTCLLLLAAHMGQLRGFLANEQLSPLVGELAKLPSNIGHLLEKNASYESLSHRFFRKEHFLYLGRGIQYPIALEGALKLKEISYIHAEGYPAGEMKHGPIALIDENMPVVAIALRDKVYEKMTNNIEEVRARGGTVIALGTEGDEELASRSDQTIFIPLTDPLLSPILAVVPLQLFAYHIAVRRGCDVDQPRNLAKTVTVE